MSKELPTPKYKIGDVVVYNGFLDYPMQGVIKDATYFDGGFFNGWRYYIKGRWGGLNESEVLFSLTSISK